MIVRQYLLILLLLITQSAGAQHRPNKIDSLTTDEQVQEFVYTVDSNLGKIEFKPGQVEEYRYKRQYDSLGIGSYYKADLDKNGLTDLVITGRNMYDFTVASDIYCILDMGERAFTKVKLSKYFLKEEIGSKVVKKDMDDLVLIYKMKIGNKDKTAKLGVDTLIYKFGKLVEYTARPHQHNIHRIKLETTPCFGACPVFSIILNEDGTVIFNAEQYNAADEKETWQIKKEIRGRYKANIGRNEYRDIAAIVNYINFPGLKKEYRIPVTDQPTVNMEITYDNGRTKKISDYGEQGSFGLRAVYDKITDLRYNQNWIADKAGNKREQAEKGNKK